MVEQNSLSAMSRKLLWHGAVLLFLGLVNGLVVQLLKNPRAGLSAHLAGVQNGMVLLIVGLAWPRLEMGRRIAALQYWSWLYGMYAIWIGLLLAAAFGTSRSTPIAGKGHVGSVLEEGLVYVFIGSGVVTTLVGGGLLVLLLRPGRAGVRSGDQ